MQLTQINSERHHQPDDVDFLASEWEQVFESRAGRERINSLIYRLRNKTNKPQRQFEPVHPCSIVKPDDRHKIVTLPGNDVPVETWAAKIAAMSADHPYSPKCDCRSCSKKHQVIVNFLELKT